VRFCKGISLWRRGHSLVTERERLGRMGEESLAVALFPVGRRRCRGAGSPGAGATQDQIGADLRPDGSAVSGAGAGASCLAMSISGSLMIARRPLFQFSSTMSPP
jgi:hypothetical protein